MSCAVYKKKKGNFFIGGRKKFGEGAIFFGKSECGMTQSSQKRWIFSQISQTKCMSVAKLSATFL